MWRPPWSPGSRSHEVALSSESKVIPAAVLKRQAGPASSSSHFSRYLSFSLPSPTPFISLKLSQSKKIAECFLDGGKLCGWRRG